MKLSENAKIKKSKFSFHIHFKTLKEDDDNDETEMKLFKGDVEEKVLGIEWNNHTDKFSFKIKNDLLELTSTEHSGHNTVNRTRLARLAGKLQRDAKIMLANAKTEVTWNGACIVPGALIAKQ
jgi:hypothetical protein